MVWPQSETPLVQPARRSVLPAKIDQQGREVEKRIELVAIEIERSNARRAPWMSPS